MVKHNSPAVKRPPESLRHRGQRLRMHQDENHFLLAHLRKHGPGLVCTDRMATHLQQQSTSKVRSEPAATHDDGTKKILLPGTMTA